jgi:hypothetical protein
MRAGAKVPITKRALLQRLNRVLKPSAKLLKKAKATQARLMGEFYVVDTKRNAIAQKKVNVEKLGRKHKVLAPWEEVC